MVGWWENHVRNREKQKKRTFRSLHAHGDGMGWEGKGTRTGKRQPTRMACVITISWMLLDDGRDEGVERTESVTRSRSVAMKARRRGNGEVVP